LQLAQSAEDQAVRWEQIARRNAGNNAAASLPPRLFQPTFRARLVARLIRQFGPRALRSVLAAMKLRGLSVYGAPTAVIVPGAASGARTANGAQATSAATTTLAPHPMPTSLAEVGARHRSAVGGNLRAAVFGVNDGLISNFSLVMGVAGAGATSTSVLMAGAAGLLAGALSMAAGEYVSVRSQREMYEYQIALEREEVAEYPDEEAEELALIYEARGVPLEQAREVSRALFARPDQALDVLAREELGLNPDDLGSPWHAAAYSFVAFSVGAFVPLLPLIAGFSGNPAIASSAAITGAALFGVGMALSLFTGRDAWRGAVRMVCIGGGAAIVSFFVGRLLGVAIS